MLARTCPPGKVRPDMSARTFYFYVRPDMSARTSFILSPSGLVRMKAVSLVDVAFIGKCSPGHVRPERSAPTCPPGHFIFMSARTCPPGQVLFLAQVGL